MTLYQNLTAIVAAACIGFGSMGNVGAEEPKLPCAQEVKASWEKFHKSDEMKCVVLDEIEPPTKVCFNGVRKGEMFLYEDCMKITENGGGTSTHFRLRMNPFSKEPYLKEFYVKRALSEPTDEGTNYDSFELEKRPDLRKEAGDKFCRYFKLALAQAEKDKNKPKEKAKEKQKSEVKPLSCEAQVKEYWESDAYYKQDCVDFSTNLSPAVVYFDRKENGLGTMYVFEVIPGAGPEWTKESAYSQRLPVQATAFKVKIRENESTYYSGKALEHPYLEEVRIELKHYVRTGEDKCSEYRLGRGSVLNGTLIDVGTSPKLRQKAEEKLCTYLTAALQKWDADKKTDLKQTEEEQLKLLEAPKK